MLKNNYMEDFVPFSIALKLNEKGFPQHITDEVYIVDNYGEEEYDIGDRLPIPLVPYHLDDCAAPTISQALKWLEKEKKVFIDTKTHIDLNGNYHFSYSIIFNGKQERQDYTFFDWERIDAYITAIDDALDNIIT